MFNISAIFHGGIHGGIRGVSSIQSKKPTASLIYDRRFLLPNLRRRESSSIKVIDSDTTLI